MKRLLCWILALLLVASQLPTEAVLATGYTVSEESVVADPDFSGEEEMLDGYVRQLLYGSVATYGRKAGDRLTGNEKLAYDALVPIIRQIAAGARSSTVIGIGRNVDTAQGFFEADSAVTFVSSELNVRTLLTALLTDLPYELYWYDKTASTMFTKFSGSVLEHLRIEFPVSENYRGSESYTVEGRYARAAAAAAKNSAAIVAKYAAATDYEKLLGYKDEICFLTDYNYDAAAGGYFSYNNDPWQLIHVFDGDDTTRVVCEGYAKAFAYLCQQTEFDAEVSCVTVSGYMAGSHMWNIVTLEGQNYLVDVTNSEHDTVGYDGSLFLAGGTGSIEEGYWIGENYYTYTLDSSTEPSRDVELWGSGPDSPLNLAPEPYAPETAPVIASGQCNEQIRWSLDQAGNLTVTGNGNIPSYTLYGAPWYAAYKNHIKKVTVKEGIRFIGAYAFAALPGLTGVAMSSTVVALEDGAFRDCTALTDVSLPLSVSSIGADAFSGCSMLEQIALPEYLLGIGDGAFSGCTALQKIEIPFQVQSIGTLAFDGCESLREIRVRTDNPYYSSDETGALYDKEKRILYKVPGVVSGHYVIPGSVTVIEAGAFADCKNMTVVTVPGGVERIGEGAFGGCFGLTGVYYIGSEAQWQAIQIAPGNDPLLAGTLRYVRCENHQTVAYAAQEPTCTAPGWEAYEVCVNCGHGNYREIPATGHDFYPYAGQVPTCTQPGWKDYGICETCGYSTYEALPATGHSLVQHPAKAPDCTQPGWDAYESCRVCDYSTYTPLPATGHRYADGICTGCGRKAETLAEGSCGTDLSWQLWEDGRLIISGTGAMPDYDGTYATPWVNFCNDIRAVQITDGVTTVGQWAFAQLPMLKEAALADTVTSVGSYGFCDCDSLETVNLGSGVAVIRDTAFENCLRLKAYRVSSDNGSYRSDAYGALLDKNQTTLLRVPAGLRGVYQLPDGVTSVDLQAFSGCGSLTGVILPESLTQVYAFAFDDCTSLRYNSYNGLQYLGSEENAYHALIKPGDANVTEVKPHHDTKVIAREAFYDCQGLTTVTIPGSVICVGMSAFSSCSGLTAVTIERGVREICDAAFSGCTALETVVIPDSVTALGKNAFSGCTALRCVKLGAGIPVIKGNTFASCLALTEITIGSGVSSIEKYAFFYCPELTAVTIPTGVTHIGENAFYYCNRLQDVYYWGSTQQWSQIRIERNNNWVNTVQLHFDAGHAHRFVSGVCSVCGCEAAKLAITTVTLRPDRAGLYLTGSFGIEDGAQVIRQGIAVSLYNRLPVADGTDAQCLRSEGTTSVLIGNILSQRVSDASNQKRAAMSIYARAYVELADGTYLYSDTAVVDLRQVTEAIDAMWPQLDGAQKTAYAAMYQKFRQVLQGWNLPNLKNFGFTVDFSGEIL